MIKSINQLVTYECNSKCRMCLIWTKGKDPHRMLPAEFAKLYAKPEFSSVEDLCISGGEPTLREDLSEIMNSILPHLPRLRMLFLSTNCTYPERTIDFLKQNANVVSEVYAVVPLEGNKDTHARIRGIDTYITTVNLLDEIRKLKIPGIKSIISMTIQPMNCNLESLNHVRMVAHENGSGFTFRPAGQSDAFYANGASKISLTASQTKLLKLYLATNTERNPFVLQLEKHLAGEETIMGSRDSNIKCLAGKISVFIKSDGKIYPCIYRTQAIGDKEKGLYFKPYKLGDKEQCPCCTECQIYPMINYRGKNESNTRKTIK